MTFSPVALGLCGLWITLGPGDLLDAGDVIPGFSCVVRRMFE
jgi:hypothetical protein